MSFENIPSFDDNLEERQEFEAGPQTDRQLIIALESTRLNFGKMELIGEENLNKIPPGAKVVVAVDHINNLSIPTAALALSRKLPIKISNQSTQFMTLKNPQGALGVVAGGKENFRGIDYDLTTGKPRAFNPENFDDMSSALDDGYALIVAVHNPVSDDKLPDKSGYAAAYLAGIEGAWILPVAVNIKTKKGIRVSEGGKGWLSNIKESLALVVERPDVEIVIGEPHQLEESSGIKRYHELFMKHKQKEKLSPGELEEFHNLRQFLNNSSDEIMMDIAKLLPEEKRGNWAPF